MVNDLELMTDKDVCAFLGCSRSFLKSRLNPAYQCKPREVQGGGAMSTFYDRPKTHAELEAYLKNHVGTPIDGFYRTKPRQPNLHETGAEKEKETNK